MATTEPRAKPLEIVLATWPHRTDRAHFFGDRTYPKISGCDSMWLALRLVDDGSYRAHVARQAISNIGLYVWWSTDSDSVHCEFRGREILSATTEELERTVLELRRLNKRVPRRLMGDSYADYVLSVLKAAKITRCVEYRGIAVKETYSPIEADAQFKLRDEIRSRSKAAA